MIKRYKDIREMVEEIKTQYSQKIAFRLKKKADRQTVYEDITYRQMADDIKSLSKYLLKNGYEKKRIAVIGLNSYNWILSYMAALCSDNCIIPLDRALLPEEIKEQLTRSEADLIFHSDDYIDALKDIDFVEKISTSEEIFSEILNEGNKLNNDSQYDNISINPDEMSVLLFTSGTTAKSKVVMLSQNNLCENIYGLVLWEKFYDDDINMALLPYHHTFGLMLQLLMFAYGVMNVFCEGLRIARCLNEYKVTVFVGVPRVIEEIHTAVERKLVAKGKDKTVKKMMRVTDFLKKIGIDIRRKVYKEVIDGLGGHLRFLVIGAAAAKPDVIKWFNSLGILTVQGYGLTEAAPTISSENADYIRAGSVGKPLPGVEVKIEDKDENGNGEILAKGGNIMLGYYKDEKNTAEVLQDGWLKTGDIGHLDKDGYLFITGRKKNVIVLHNGKNVFPEELETLINDSKAVKECIVYNKPDNDLDCIHAKIVCDTNSGIEDFDKEISEHIKAINEKLVSYKQIQSYELTTKEMVKTSTLKIKRHLEMN